MKDSVASNRAYLAARYARAFLALLILIPSLQGSPLQLHYESIKLTTGQVHQDATIRSYNADNGRVILMADRSIVSVHFNQLPETIQTDITTALGGEDLNPPESSSSPEKGVNVVKTYRPPSSAVSQQPPRPAVDAIEAQQRQREQAFKTIALDMIKNRVFQYYRYEHRLGSNNVLVLRDTMAFDRIDSNRNYQFDTWQMTIRGKVGVEFYDSRRREYRRILAVFAATAEEDTNREVRISHFRHIKQN